MELNPTFNTSTSTRMRILSSRTHNELQIPSDTMLSRQFLIEHLTTNSYTDGFVNFISNFKKLDGEQKSQLVSLLSLLTVEFACEETKNITYEFIQNSLKNIVSGKFNINHNHLNLLLYIYIGDNNSTLFPSTNNISHSTKYSEYAKRIMSYLYIVLDDSNLAQSPFNTLHIIPANNQGYIKDISESFLASDSKYKIYRKIDGVYVVNTKSIELKLWGKDPYKVEFSKTFLGSGDEGTVYQTSKYKAKKNLDCTFYEYVLKLMCTTEVNEKLLDGKFKVEELGISKNFTFGLWHINKQSFMMPVVITPPKSSGSIYKATLKKYEEFIVAIYKFNQAGFFHPDLANSLNHRSEQNVLLDNMGDLMLIDMCNTIKEDYDNYLYLKDQWLWFANNLDSTNKTLYEFYNNNTMRFGEKTNLSDNPAVLNELYISSIKNGRPLMIPREIRSDLKIGEFSDTWPNDITVAEFVHPTDYFRTYHKPMSY